MKLLSYKFLIIVPFGFGEYYTSYELTVLKTSWFGLIKKVKTINYKISMFDSVKEHEEHWDTIIKMGAKIKVN